jgi:hypothetical protein
LIVVFNAATIYWPEALSGPPGYLRPSEYLPRHGPDPRVQAITRDVPDRFARSPVIVCSYTPHRGSGGTQSLRPAAAACSEGLA